MSEAPEIEDAQRLIPVSLSVHSIKTRRRTMPISLYDSVSDVL